MDVDAEVVDHHFCPEFTKELGHFATNPVTPPGDHRDFVLQNFLSHVCFPLLYASMLSRLPRPSDHSPAAQACRFLDPTCRRCATAHPPVLPIVLARRLRCRVNDIALLYTFRLALAL